MRIDERGKPGPVMGNESFAQGIGLSVIVERPREIRAVAQRPAECERYLDPLMRVRGQLQSLLHRFDIAIGKGHAAQIGDAEPGRTEFGSALNGAPIGGGRLGSHAERREVISEIGPENRHIGCHGNELVVEIDCFVGAPLGGENARL